MVGTQALRNEFHTPVEAAHGAALSTARRWDWLPMPSLCVANALLLIALAFTGARLDLAGAGSLFWAGLAALFVPIAFRLSSPRTSQAEHIGLLLLCGVGLYLVKVLHSPLAFTFHDEFIHWRSTQDIVTTGTLFHENPLITVSPYFPGLQIVTSAVMELTGLGVFGAGVIVLGMARVVLVLSLYLFFHEVVQSRQIASIATLLYMANPNCLFVGAQYAYESLALAVAGLALFTVARRTRARQTGGLISANLAILLSLCGLVMTHHLTSYALVAFLTLWSVMPYAQRIGRSLSQWYAGKATNRELLQAFKRSATSLGTGAGSGGVERVPGEAALLALVLSLAWLAYVAILVVGYLSPVLSKAFAELVGLIAGEMPGRRLFRDFAGQRPPLWEQLMGYSSVLLILAALPWGLLRIWRQHRANALALCLAAGSLSYPVTLALRFTQAGAETSNRSSEFVFVPIAFVLAVGVAQVQQVRRAKVIRSMAFTAWASVIFLGGAIIGWPPWARLPGPYLVAADTRSVEPLGIAAAEWAKTFLGPGNRVGADRINRLLMATYGEQRVVTNLSDDVNVAYAFFSPQFDRVGRSVLEQARLDYIVVDHRLSRGLPLAGTYFENGEPDSNEHRTPIDPAGLRKFDDLPLVSRLFDSGDIVLYDVGVLGHAR